MPATLSSARGEYGETLFFVLNGSVLVRLKRGSGEETVLALLRRGDIFGELTVLGQRPRSATVVANEAVEPEASAEEEAAEEETPSKTLYNEPEVNWDSMVLTKPSPEMRGHTSYLTFATFYPASIRAQIEAQDGDVWKRRPVLRTVDKVAMVLRSVAARWPSWRR